MFTFPPLIISCFLIEMLKKKKNFRSLKLIIFFFLLFLISLLILLIYYWLCWWVICLSTDISVFNGHLGDGVKRWLRSMNWSDLGVSCQHNAQCTGHIEQCSLRPDQGYMEHCSISHLTSRNLSSHHEILMSIYPVGNWVKLEYCICIMTRGGIYSEI